MECDNYTVTLEEEGWSLRLNEHVLGSGMDQECAQRAATVAARISRRRGRKVVVSFDDRIDGTSPAAHP
jgi:hypothetical protein